MEKSLFEALTIEWLDGNIKTNYYGSITEKSGYAVGTSWHGGIDIILPRMLIAYDNSTGHKVEEESKKITREMKTGKFVQCLCSDEFVHFTFDDLSNYPYCFAMQNEQFVMLPSAEDNGKTREIRVWAYNRNKGKMFRALALPCELIVERMVA